MCGNDNLYFFFLIKKKMDIGIFVLNEFKMFMVILCE